MNATPAPSVADFLAPSRRRPHYLERRSILRALQQLRQHVSSGRILDVGCGLKPYETLFRQPGFDYVGVDYPITLTHSYQHATRADVFGDCLRLPFAAASFGTVLSTQVVEHVPDPAACVAEMARVLRPGGTLLISGPMCWPLHEEPYDFYRYTIHGLRHLLTRVHLEVLAELPRGAALSTLGQMFLDVHVAGGGRPSIVRRTCTNLVALVVNSVCEVGDRLWPNRRLCLGWAIAARKPR